MIEVSPFLVILIYLLFCLIYLLTFLYILDDSKLHSKHKNFEDILNRTKDISVSLRWVIRLSQWFIMVCILTVLYIRFPQLIKLTHNIAEILLKVVLKTITLPYPGAPGFTPSFFFLVALCCSSFCFLCCVFCLSSLSVMCVICCLYLWIAHYYSSFKFPLLFSYFKFILFSKWMTIYI